MSSMPRRPRHRPRGLGSRPSGGALLGLCAVAALLAAACGDDLQDLVADRYSARCATPRNGPDPTTNQRFDDVQGTLDDEKRFLAAWINDLYLWYREVPTLDPADFDTPLAYFDALKTSARTPSGKAKDQFHFTYPTAEWLALSRGGMQGGYGVQWAVLASRPPRRIVVAYSEPDSPAAAAGLRRGAEVIEVDGVDVELGDDVATLNAGLFPEKLGVAHTFLVRDLGGGLRTVTMTSANITSAPVQNVTILDTPTGAVGYLTFNDHIATAEAALAAAIRRLQTAQVTDLVLDLRYNGGGYLDIAAELAFMIAGPAATNGKAFETVTFNDKYREVDPFGRALSPSPFWARAVGFSLPAGQELPSLGLARVYVLTGPSTCSASEAVINGLRGVDVEVIQIGATTCGKPYGFYPQDNCGTTYFAIQFQGVNDKGYGDYADGFTPGGSDEAGLPGCAVADDFTQPLGAATEARLATALAYRATGSCPPVATLRRDAAGLDLSATEGALRKPPWLRNRIMTGPPAAAR